MRNYQRQKNNPYKLPHNLYMRMLYLVRDYDRIREQGREREREAVDGALHAIPAEYRKGVWDNVIRQAPYPSDAGEATYKRWRCRFIYNVAKNLGEI